MKSVTNHALEMVAGFLMAGISTLMLGLAAAWVLATLTPGWLRQWPYMSASQRIAVLAPGLAVILGLAFFFWRRRRFLSVGILMFLVADVLLAVYG